MTVFGKDRLLDMISTGWTFKRIAAQFTAETGQDCSTYYVSKTLQSFGPEYEEAKRAQAEYHADRLAEITEDVETGKIDSSSARVSSDNRKWLAARRNPREYGDKVQAEVLVADVSKSHIESLRLKMEALLVPNLLTRQSQEQVED